MRKALLVIGSAFLFIAMWQLFSLALTNLLEDTSFRVFFTGMLSGALSYIIAAFIFWDQMDQK